MIGWTCPDDGYVHTLIYTLGLQPPPQKMLGVGLEEGLSKYFLRMWLELGKWCHSLMLPTKVSPSNRSEPLLRLPHRPGGVKFEVKHPIFLAKHPAVTPPAHGAEWKEDTNDQRSLHVPERVPLTLEGEEHQNKENK